MGLYEIHLQRDIHGEPGTTIVLAYTDTAGVTTAYLTVDTEYEIMSTTDCHVKISAAGTSATTADWPFIAKQPKFIKIIDANKKLSAIRSSESGTIYITPRVGKRE